MISEVTTDILQAFAEAWNRHDADAIMAFMTEDCVFEASAGPDICGTRYSGRDAVRASFVEVWTTFPDAHWRNARHFIQGERGVSEWTFTGTRADGSRVEVHGCDLFTFSDGKIALKNSYRKNRPPLACRLFADEARGGDQIMDVIIKDRPELRVATLRHVGPYNQISEAFARLGEIAGPAGLIQAAPTMLALYHDDPETTPAAELRSDAALVISPDAQLPAGLGEQRLRGGRYACTTHVGPYEQLGDVWGRFMGDWLPRSGHRMSDGATYEIYRNTPGQVSKEKLETELYIPLDSGSGE